MLSFITGNPLSFSISCNNHICSSISNKPRRYVSISTRTRPTTLVCCTSESSANDEEEKDETSTSQLPPGSASSKSIGDEKVNNLGFVGAERIGISFTCTVNDCNTRITKNVRRRSYETGTVLIQCPTCEKHHVVADHQGMYSALTGGKKNIEEIATAKGESVTRVDNTVFNLEDIISNLKTEKEERTDKNEQ